MSDMIVADSEYTELATVASQLGSAIESDLEKYLSVMKVVTSGPLSSGDVYENVVAFTADAQKLKGQAEAIAALLGQDGTDFLQDIIAADKTLY